MFLIFKSLHQILKLLNSERAPSQLSAGIVFGMIVGLTPFMSLHNLFIFFVVCLFRVNLSFFFVSLALHTVLGFALDPLFDWFGYQLLVHFAAARPLWIYFASSPIWPYFRFNNTVVIGSLVFSLLIATPYFFICWKSIYLYRATLREQLRQSQLVKALAATPIYGYYEKYQTFRNKFS